jgi:hypothetical protein
MFVEGFSGADCAPMAICRCYTSVIENKHLGWYSLKLSLYGITLASEHLPVAGRAAAAIDA